MFCKPAPNLSEQILWLAWVGSIRRDMENTGVTSCCKIEHTVSPGMTMPSNCPWHPKAMVGKMLSILPRRFDGRPCPRLGSLEKMLPLGFHWVAAAANELHCGDFVVRNRKIFSGMRSYFLPPKDMAARFSGKTRIRISWACRHAFLLCFKDAWHKAAGPPLFVKRPASIHCGCNMDCETWQAGCETCRTDCATWIVKYWKLIVKLAGRIVKLVLRNLKFGLRNYEWDFVKLCRQIVTLWGEMVKLVLWNSAETNCETLGKACDTAFVKLWKHMVIL